VQEYTVEILFSETKDVPSSFDNLMTIPPDSIKSLLITESVLTLLPKIELVVADKGTFLEGNPLSDKDVLHVSLNNQLDLTDTEIYTPFMVSSVTATSDSFENQGVYIKVVGYMAADNAFSPYKYNAINGSSDTVIRKIALEMGLKFKADATGSESNYWYQNGNNYQYIKHVANRSYVPQDGVFVYGTLDGTINYTTIKTRMALDNIFTGVFDRDHVQNNVLLDEDLPYMYYDGYEIVDLSETYNNMCNYGGVVNKYNLLEYVEDPLVNLDKTTDLSNKRESYTTSPVFSDNLGIIGSKPLQDTIYNGKLQNTFTKYQLFSNSISININNSTNVSLFDKVDLAVPSLIDGDSIAEPYSGEYVVASISHSIVLNAGYAKRVLLCRNGINKSVLKKDYNGVV